MPVTSSNKPYRVGRSRTGLGLFATKPIKKGTRIIRYTGPLLDSRKKAHDEIENKYLFEINGRWTIDGSLRKNVARYINHSCRPNAESDVRPREHRVYIRAIKNIGPGEEINYDYGTDYFKAYLKPIGCKCDSCERKRKKQRAEARAERARLQARAGSRTKNTRARSAQVRNARPKNAQTKNVQAKNHRAKKPNGKSRQANGKTANGRARRSA